jgi:hypothetical protein
MTTLLRLLRDRRIAAQRAEAIQRALDVAAATAAEATAAPSDKLAHEPVPTSAADAV